MKKALLHFLPFAVCSLYTVLAIVVSRSVTSPSWVLGFASVLPMCFFFTAGNTLRMQKELEELRGKLSSLERGQNS